ncbi:conserved Plasmodium protein, unknown function [Plasmodium gallinaceum]|uniref:Uncharacterized protein n=1 Tax=Plasmodium gallinaceum TaxID=5849 RepID=A0A1J1GPL3_PLAGA|nr:conserved Plasmodium protein, unknown function [Plasmodium gallinaceum]CRG94365.1 conserved Plasmodium protein, unknown function [Plasmodium gallinaceum]
MISLKYIISTLNIIKKKKYKNNYSSLCRRYNCSLKNYINIHTYKNEEECLKDIIKLHNELHVFLNSNCKYKNDNQSNNNTINSDLYVLNKINKGINKEIFRKKYLNKCNIYLNDSKNENYEFDNKLCKSINNEENKIEKNIKEKSELITKLMNEMSIDQIFVLSKKVINKDLYKLFLIKYFFSNKKKINNINSNDLISFFFLCSIYIFDKNIYYNLFHYFKDTPYLCKDILKILLNIIYKNIYNFKSNCINEIVIILFKLHKLDSFNFSIDDINNFIKKLSYLLFKFNNKNIINKSNILMEEKEKEFDKNSIYINTDNKSNYETNIVCNNMNNIENINELEKKDTIIYKEENVSKKLQNSCFYFSDITKLLYEIISFHKTLSVNNKINYECLNEYYINIISNIIIFSKNEINNDKIKDNYFWKCSISLLYSLTILYDKKFHDDFIDIFENCIKLFFRFFYYDSEKIKVMNYYEIKEFLSRDFHNMNNIEKNSYNNSIDILKIRKYMYDSIKYIKNYNDLNISFVLISDNDIKEKNTFLLEEIIKFLHSLAFYEKKKNGLNEKRNNDIRKIILYMLPNVNSLIEKFIFQILHDIKTKRLDINENRHISHESNRKEECNNKNILIENNMYENNLNENNVHLEEDNSKIATLNCKDKNSINDLLKYLSHFLNICYEYRIKDMNLFYTITFLVAKYKNIDLIVLSNILNIFSKLNYCFPTYFICFYFTNYVRKIKFNEDFLRTNFFPIKEMNQKVLLKKKKKNETNILSNEEMEIMNLSKNENLPQVNQKNICIISYIWKKFLKNIKENVNDEKRLNDLLPVNITKLINGLIYYKSLDKKLIEIIMKIILRHYNSKELVKKKGKNEKESFNLICLSSLLNYMSFTDDIQCYNIKVKLIKLIKNKILKDKNSFDGRLLCGIYISYARLNIFDKTLFYTIYKRLDLKKLNIMNIISIISYLNKMSIYDKEVLCDCFNYIFNNIKNSLKSHLSFLIHVLFILTSICQLYLFNKFYIILSYIFQIIYYIYEFYKKRNFNRKILSYNFYSMLLISLHTLYHFFLVLENMNLLNSISIRYLYFINYILDQIYDDDQVTTTQSQIQKNVLNILRQILDNQKIKISYEYNLKNTPYHIDMLLLIK